MKYICVTEIDSKTGIPCTVEPQRNGPLFPKTKGWQFNWADESTWPVEISPNGTYLRAPKYYGTCDDDADTTIQGVLEVLSKEKWEELKQIEILARKPYPSWVLIGDNWVAPIPRPYDAIWNGGNVAYQWDEETVNWIPLEE